MSSVTYSDKYDTGGWSYLPNPAFAIWCEIWETNCLIKSTGHTPEYRRFGAVIWVEDTSSDRDDKRVHPQPPEVGRTTYKWVDKMSMVQFEPWESSLSSYQVDYHGLSYRTPHDRHSMIISGRVLNFETMLDGIWRVMIVHVLSKSDKWCGGSIKLNVWSTYGVDNDGIMLIIVYDKTI